MKRKLNVVFGKIGKALSFKQGKWGMIGGDHEVPALLSVLAQMNPHINFYILSRSDWHSLTLAERAVHNFNGNIHDIWEDWDTKSGIGVTDWPLEAMRRAGITADFGIVVSGPTGLSTIPNAMMTMDGDRVATPSMMSERYVGPITKFLNTTGIKWIEIGEDPRYFPVVSRDLFNRPAYICATRNLEQHKTIQILSDYFKPTQPYSPRIKDLRVSEMFLASEDAAKKLKEPGTRSNLISVYSNGLRQLGGIQKFPAIKEYVLDQFSEAVVYGDWPEETPGIKPYSARIIAKPMIELVDQMYSTKYAFMIPIIGGWPTSKFYKHLMLGMIPFFHPLCNTEYYRMPTELEKFLTVKSPAEMKTKIALLEENAGAYLGVWCECQRLLKPAHFTGEYINCLILSEIKSLCPAASEIDLTPLPSRRNPMSCLFPAEATAVPAPEQSGLESFF